MKYECQILCGAEPETVLRQMLANAQQASGGFQVCFLDFDPAAAPPSDYRRYVYDDAPYYVFDGQYAIDRFGQIFQSLQAAFATHGQLALAIFDNFSTYAQMYDRDFPHLKTAFYFGVHFYTAPTPNTPRLRLRRLHTNEPLDSYCYLPAPYTVDICTTLKKHSKRQIRKRLAVLFGTEAA